MQNPKEHAIRIRIEYLLDLKDVKGNNDDYNRVYNELKALDPSNKIFLKIIRK